MRRGRSGRASALYLYFLLVSLQFFFVSGDVARKMDSAQRMRVTLTYHVLMYRAGQLFIRPVQFQDTCCQGLQGISITWECTNVKV